MSIDKEFRESIQKAMNEAEDRFYKYLEKKGYVDCISFELTVNIVDSNYESIFETLKYSNLQSLIKVKNQGVDR
ncbi:MAG: hypothetical protein IMZ52_10135 [Actinobacteria bacterium]|nr:hypothetical protein [Actinomycetota bacterium]MBE3122575.1 hypothetical protein [Thermoplasmata archaeon]